MSQQFDAHVNEHDFRQLVNGISRLQGQLPTHQVAGLRKAGEYMKQAMRSHAKPMYFTGRVDQAIGWAESHEVVAGSVVGKSTVVVIGPGARGGREGGMPPEAPLMEAGWKQKSIPNMGRMRAWASQRIPGITPREVWYIARALRARGALSERNPRAHGDRGYFYVQATFDDEGQRALDELNASGFALTASILKSI